MRRIAGLCLVLLSLSAVSVFGAEWTGYLSCSNCAAKKGDNPDHAACAKSCVANGAAVVLASGGKVYTLDKQEEARKMTGEKVVVKGSAGEDGTSIKVDSIKKAS